jgi:amino acid transporter
MLPGVLTNVHPRYHTPAVAIVTYAVVVSALAISGSFAQLAILANVAALSLYLLCVAASYELQRRDVRMAGAAFALAGGPVVPLLAAAGIVWLLAQATAREFQIEAVVLIFATILYVGRRLFPSRVKAPVSSERLTE